MRFGFNDFYPTPEHRTHIPLMYGDVVRHSPGQAGSVAGFDVAVEALAHRGIDTVMVLGYGGRTLDEWRHAVGWWAARYRHSLNVIAFELGNEPNMAKFNKTMAHPEGIAFTPQEAAAYTMTGFLAAKGVGWAKPLLTAGPARIDGRDAWTGYLREMFKSGIPDEMHLAMHPYSEGGQDYLASIEWQVSAARKVLKNRSGHRKYWATEYGYSSLSNEAEQAKRLVKATQLLRDKDVQAGIVFRYADGPATEQDQYRTYGVCHADFTPKPAYHLLKREAQ